MSTDHIERLEAVLDGYDALLCDVWGVLHNGVVAWPDAYQALGRARAAGKTVILLTNAPRPHQQVRTQIGALGVPQTAYDDVVTSGDVTRTLIARGPQKVFHLGAERDLTIFDGLDVTLVSQADAQAFVCTGLVDDESETPDDYADLLAQLNERGLPMICANPDIVVERGHRMVYCAGALAQLYRSLGGRTEIAGKPYSPIYDEAMGRIAVLAGTPVKRSSVLVIGDGMATDIKGAIDNGFDHLFVTDGIHARSYGETGSPNQARLDSFLAEHGARPIATMTRLA